MIRPEDLAGVGFTDDQITVLVRAFERIDLASAQRFNALQDQINKLSIRVEEIYTELRGAIDLTRKATDDRFDRMDQRFDGLEKRMDERFDRMDERFDRMDERFDRIEAALRGGNNGGTSP